MVESLKELNKICQKPRYKEAGNWMVRNILRDAALPVTWLLLHTPVTANQMTLASLIIGLVGIFFFALPSGSSFLIGALLLQLWYFLDHVDGQIARYRKTSCLSGRFFDFITHHLIHGVIFFSLGFHASLQSGNIFPILWGFITSISTMMFNLVHDTKYKTFFERLVSVKTVEVIPSDPSGENTTGKTSLWRKGFSLLHKLSEIHVLMNLLTLAAILQFKTPFDLRTGFFIFYGIAVPLIAVVKIAYLITRKEIDREFDRTFRV